MKTFLPYRSTKKNPGIDGSGLAFHLDLILGLVLSSASEKPPGRCIEIAIQTNSFVCDGEWFEEKRRSSRVGMVESSCYPHHSRSSSHSERFEYTHQSLSHNPIREL